MQYLEMILLGVVQGIAEFLPISSSGHLLVLGALQEQLGAKLPGDMLSTEIVLHAGTLLSILVVYWKRIWRLLGQDRRVIGLLAVGTLPAVAVGFPLHEYARLRALLENPLLAGLMLPVSGALLLWSRRRQSGETGYVEMTYTQALVIGLAQAFAILPGISRSGATIVAGLAVGLRRDSAAAYSFLLAIPATSGAIVLALKDLLPALAGHSSAGASAAASSAARDLAELAVGAGVSFVVGLVSLLILLKWLSSGRLHLFAYWCIGAGVAVIAWQVPRFW